MTNNNTLDQLGTAKQLCDYTAAVLAQMLSVIQPYVGVRHSDYAAHVGAHTRHIIEHYDTLAKALNVTKSDPQAMCTADYDARERNLEIETNPLEAIRRIGWIDAALGSRSGLDDAAVLQIVHVYIRGGLSGEHNFCAPSTLAR